VTANHGRQAQKDALNAFGGQSDRGHSSDLTGGKSLPVTKPKNCALSFLILPGGDQSENSVDLLDLKAPAYCIGAIGDGGSEAVLEASYLIERFGVPCTPFRGQERLEMIVDDIDRDHLQESINRIFVPRLERSQQTAVVLAELQVGVLDEVVQLRARRFTPAAGSPEDGGGNHHLKSPDEFGPRPLVGRASAQLH